MAQSITISNPGAAGNARSEFRFQRADGKFIDMPEESDLKEIGTKRRVKVMDRLRRDGGIAIGDRTVGIRKYDLTWGNFGTESDDQTVRDNHNKLEGFFREDQEPIYLIQKNENIRGQVVLTGHGVTHPRGNRNRKNDCVLNLQLVDALWESEDEFAFPGGTGSQTGETGGTGGAEQGVGVTLNDEDEITVTNNAQFDVFPRFYIVPQNNVVKFSLVNSTLGGGLEFDSNDLLSGTLLILDSSEGSVTLDGIEKSAGLTQGGFIFLAPGDNVLKYESSGGSISLELVWRERYVI